MFCTDVVSMEMAPHHVEPTCTVASVGTMCGLPSNLQDLFQTVQMYLIKS